MLEQIRKSSQSLLIYVLFGIIIAVFIINFGPQARGSGCEGPETPVGAFAAKVDGRTISQNDFRYGFVLMRGAQIPLQQAKMARVKERVMDKLIERELLAEEAERMGFRVGEDQVAEMVAESRIIGLGFPTALPYSQKDGKFDYESFKKFVQFELGLAPKAFMAEQQRELLAFKVREMMRDAVKVSPAEVKAAWEKSENRVNLEYVRVSPQRYEDELEPGADEIAKFAADGEAKLKARYDERKFLYEKAPLELKLRHILIEIEPKASEDQEAAAEKKAEAVVKRVRGGEAFAHLAREISEDGQSKRRGGALGWRRKTATGLGIAVDEKLYGTKPGEQAKNGDVVGPLRGSRGYEVVLVEGSREGDLPFDKVKLDLAEDMLRTEKARGGARAEAEAVLAHARAVMKTEKDKTWKDLFPGEHEDKKPDDKKAAPKPARPKGRESREAAFSSALKAEETGIFTRRGAVVEGIGISADLAKAAFELRPETPLGGPFEVGGGFVVVRLKERKTADPAEFERRKNELVRDAALSKWDDVVAEWAQRRCEIAKEKHRIEVNTDIVRYDEGPEKPVAYTPCTAMPRI